MKTNNQDQLRFQVKKFFLLLTLFTVLLSSNIYGQEGDVNPQEIIKLLAKYTSTSEITTQFLTKQGYEPPKYIQKEWKQYPAIRKIEMAYEAAENGRKGKGGQSFLAMLSQDLARQYQAIRSEKTIQPMLENPQTKHNLSFVHPRKYGKIKLPKNVRSQIYTITKYTDNGAMGGIRGVLKTKFDLSDDKIYKILSRSSSTQEALERGLAKSKVPPSHQERLNNINKAIQKKYGHINSPTTQSKPIKDQPKKDVVQIKNEKHLKIKKFDNFVKKNYPTTQVKFSRSIRMRGGFGGVIFGNTVTDNSKLPNIKTVRYIPSDTNSDDIQRGTLEFIFENGKEYLETDIYAEDVVAAHNITTNINYDIDDAIGMVGIYNPLRYPDGYRRWEAIVHPEILNFELGWTALLTDAYPIAYNLLLDKIINDTTNASQSLREWNYDSPETWKIMDVPMEISNNNNELILRRNDIPDSLSISEIYLTMHGFGGSDETGKESKLFYQAMPALVDVTYAYYRMNEFARVMALFRWTTIKGGKLINIPQNVNYIKDPESIFVKSDDIKYLTPQDEYNAFMGFKQKKLNVVFSKFKIRNSHQVLNKFNSDLEAFNSKLANDWKLLENPYQHITKICNMSWKIPSSLTNIEYIKLEEHQKIIDLLKSEIQVLTLIKCRYCVCDN